MKKISELRKMVEARKIKKIQNEILLIKMKIFLSQEDKNRIQKLQQQLDD